MMTFTSTPIFLPIIIM